MENWILAKTLNGDDVKVRQGEQFSKMFIGENGTMFDVSDLDFTESKTEDFDVFKHFEEGQKRFEEQNAIHNDLMNRILASMDADAIADHKAEIDEREYWRKLRGDVFVELIKQDWVNNKDHALSLTKDIINTLYEQDVEFVKDKHYVKE